MDVSLALMSFAGLLGAWVAIGRRRNKTPKLTIMDLPEIDRRAA